MKKFPLGLTIAGIALAHSLQAQAGRSDILPSAKRAVTVELAQKINTRIPPAAAALPKDIVNPFNPPGFDGPDADELAALQAAAAARKSQPKSGHDLLVDLASQMQPTGSATMGGESYLLFGQKKMKVGERLTINFEGGVYTVEVSAIERTSFTIKLNRDEYTRPIKSGKNP